MSKDGFVYFLTNRAMPGLFKIGRTERNPRRRIAELSTKSGLPFDFDLLCYIDVPDDVAAEYWFHRCFADLRANAGREFFRLDIAHLAFEIAQFLNEGDYSEFIPCDLPRTLYEAHGVDFKDIRQEWEREGLRDRVFAPSNVVKIRAV